MADEAKERLAKRQATAAVALLKLHRPEKVWPLLQQSADNRRRSYLIHRLSPLGADSAALLQRFEEEKDPSIRRALLLSLGEFTEQGLLASERTKLVPRLLRLYRDDPDSCLHGAAAWLLRRWGQQGKLRTIDRELATGKVEGQRQWYVTGPGQTFVVFPGPTEFVMGSPPAEAGRGAVERLHHRRIGRSFAMASTHVTVEQFQRFRPRFGNDHMHFCPEPDCPILGVTWYDAAEYCNWLSRQEGLKEDQWCYLPRKDDAFAEGMQLAPDYLRRTGYRLPTEAEWEWACRAGAQTSRYYGETEELLPSYAWYFLNSKSAGTVERTWPVGLLKPNDRGLFDMHGDVFAWCQERYNQYPSIKMIEDKEDIAYINDRERRLWRGGAFTYHAEDVRCARRDRNVPADRYNDVGFRPARTVTP